MNVPSLEEKELRTTFESIRKAELEKREKENFTNDNKATSQANRLLQIIESNKDNVEFFHDYKKEPYVRITVKGHKETWSTQSRMLSRLMQNIYWNNFHEPISNDALMKVVGVIEGKALFEGKEYRLHNRVACFEGAIWYDLSDDKWRTVKITKEGWEIVKDPPILFKRYGHQRPQVEPVKGGDVKSLLKFINIKDIAKQLLLLVYLISCFIFGFPHTILIVYGAQGSAKSTLKKLLKRLIDPSIMELVTLVGNQQELVQQLSHHWFSPFDNISDLSDACSDTLCKVSTGAGQSKRALYTDEEDKFFNLYGCVALNGINLVAKKPDLLDRSILVELARIPKEERQTEQELLDEFEKERPRILGAIFDTISKVMNILPTINVPVKHRMADFTKHGCAIALALGCSMDDFLRAYGVNIESQNDEVLNESLVAQILIPFIESQPSNEWEGIYSHLLKELENEAKNQKIDIKDPDFPKRANVLSKELNKLKTNLEEIGIYIKKGGRGRKIRITKESKSIVSIVTTVPLIDTASNNKELNNQCNDRNDCNSSAEELDEMDTYTKPKN